MLKVVCGVYQIVSGALEFVGCLRQGTVLLRLFSLNQTLVAGGVA